MTARREAPDLMSPDASGEGAATQRDAKRVLRRRLLDARAARSADDRAAATAALSAHVRDLATGLTGPVACYLPVGGEPGARGSGTGTVADALLADGHTVLAPVVPAEPGALDWTTYTGPDGMTTGPLGVREPAGPRLGVEAVGTAALVLVPALAVDRRGMRLGRGGGYYDRTLPLIGPDALVAVLLYDDELLDEVPAEPHDTPVPQVVLPGRGVVQVSP
ncbi:5-formyltetrahydrofolate cyclo-ligase [Pseudonocardia phyllosphaerae]|uniref:5-formyltetrahydrofolate cyclo-ligase n=1 Tax=Pseudonocardia phyllosphaerae TaxID=3390502 RepID=UPI00397A0AC4